MSKITFYFAARHNCVSKLLDAIEVLRCCVSAGECQRVEENKSGKAKLVGNLAEVRDAVVGQDDVSLTVVSAEEGEGRWSLQIGWNNPSGICYALWIVSIGGEGPWPQIQEEVEKLAQDAKLTIASVGEFWQKARSNTTSTDTFRLCFPLEHDDPSLHTAESPGYEVSIGGINIGLQWVTCISYEVLDILHLTIPTESDGISVRRLAAWGCTVRIADSPLELDAGLLRVRYSRVAREMGLIAAMHQITRADKERKDVAYVYPVNESLGAMHWVLIVLLFPIGILGALLHKRAISPGRGALFVFLMLICHVVFVLSMSLTNGRDALQMAGLALYLTYCYVVFSCAVGSGESRKQWLPLEILWLRRIGRTAGALACVAALMWVVLCFCGWVGLVLPNHDHP